MSIADTARSLLALCEEATPGPWVHVPERAVDVRTAADKMIAATWTDTVSEYDPRPSGKKDGAYIAACSPETIAQLCRAYLERERDAERAQTAVRDLLAIHDWMVEAGGTEGPLPQDVIQKFAEMLLPTIDDARKAIAGSIPP